MDKLNCRRCGNEKPSEELTTRFTLWGKERVRFHQCDECKRLAKKSYRKGIKYEPAH